MKDTRQLLKVAEECNELAQVAIKLAMAKTEKRKKKLSQRYLSEKRDVLAAMKAVRQSNIVKRGKK